MWRPWELGTATSNDKPEEQISSTAGTERKTVRANVCELEKKFVYECYNLSMGKEWKQVLLFTKERILDAGLPQRVIKIYIDAPQDRVITRMRNIIRKALATPLPSTSTCSKLIYVEEQAELQKNQMKYASKETPAQRKLQSKLRKTFAASSSESDSESKQQQSNKKKMKSDREVAREAQEAHKELCTKAMDTLDKVNSLLVNEDKEIKKNNQNKKS